MRFKQTFSLLATLVISTIVSAQEAKKLSLKIEMGGNDVTGTLYDSWNIRQDVGSYYNSTTNSVSSDLFATNFAAKLEYALFDHKFAISSGLQLTNLNSNVYIVGNMSNENGFFYLRYLRNGPITEYAKVKSITESANYLSIPLDFKFVPISLWKCDFYIRTGIDFGVLVGSKTAIDFANPDMATYENTILSNLDIYQNPIISSWNTSIGASFGSWNKLLYNFEILLPSMYLTTHNSSIFKDEIFTGFKISVQFPIK